MGCCKCEEHGWKDKPKETYISEADGKEYCLFHAPHEEKRIDGEKISGKEFNEQVFKRIQATIDLEDEEAMCDLRGVIFPSGVCFAFDSFLPPISFKEVTFKGDVDFSSVKFRSYADFRFVEFEKSAKFISAKFMGNVSFNSSIFTGKVKFSFAKFEGKVFFWSTMFERKAQFTSAEFGGDTDFNGACFGMGAYFSNARFCGESIFDGVCFARATAPEKSNSSGSVFLVSGRVPPSAQFQRAIFEKSAHFELTSFQVECNFSQSLFAYVDFIGIRSPGPLIFRRCKVNEGQFIDTDLSAFDFLDMDVTNLSFPHKKWPEESGRYKISQEDKLGNLPFVHDFYRRMKAKYKAENNEYEASKWHIAEKEAQLKLLWKETKDFSLRFWKSDENSEADTDVEQVSWGERVNLGNSILWLGGKLSQILTWLALLLYKWSSSFGEKPFRALFWLILFIALPYFFPGDMRKYIPLMQLNITESQPVMKSFEMAGWQLLITIQAALFAFALRNIFRR